MADNNLTQRFNDWKSAHSRAEQLKLGGEISDRELNDLKTQARQAGMIPIGNALFNNWDEALAHARELHGRGAISTPEFIDFGRQAEFAKGQNNNSQDILDRVRRFLRNYGGGPSPAY